MSTTDHLIIQKRGSFDLDLRTGLTPAGLVASPVDGSQCLLVRVGGGEVLANWAKSGVVTIAGANVPLVPNSANYLELDTLRMVIAVNASAFTSGRPSLFKITTSTGINAANGDPMITQVEDHRGEVA